MQHKAFAPSIKSVTGDGTVSVVMATMNVIDKDGDVTERGFFGQQVAQIVPAHDWSSIPLGKARIREVGDEAVAELAFNLDVPAAADWYRAIKYDFENPPALQEYSYGFDILGGGSRYGEHQGHRVRFLQPLKDGRPGVRVFEVSPVMVGAGLGTRTLAVKRDGRPADGLDENTRAWIRQIAERVEGEYAQNVIRQAKAHLEQGRVMSVFEEAQRHLATWYVALDDHEVPEWKRAVAAVALSKHCEALNHRPLPTLQWFRDEKRAERDHLELHGEVARKGFGWIGEGRLVGKAMTSPMNEVWLNVSMHHAADIDAITGHEVRHLTGGDEDQAQAYEAKARAEYWNTEGLK